MTEFDADDESLTPPSQRQGRRTIVLALLFLVIVGGGSYAIRVFYSGATLLVEADPAATAVLGTANVTLHEVDGPLFYTLRVGRQSVRPGRYRIEVDWDKTDLRFSTGPEFTARRGKQLTINVVGQSRER